MSVQQTVQQTTKWWISLKSILLSVAIRHGITNGVRDAGPAALTGGNWRATIRQKYIHISIPANIFYSISSAASPHTMLARVLTRARPQRNLLTQRFSTASAPRTKYTYRTTALLAGIASAVRVHLHHTQRAG